MRSSHSKILENYTGDGTTAQQKRAFSREKAAGIDDAKVTPKRMNFRLELILMLLAVAAIGFVGLGTACAADGELISPKSVPKIGSFYRMQRQTPPLPFNPFPDLPVYAVDWYRHIFLIDDRSVDYEQLEKDRKALAVAEGLDEGGPENGPAYDGYGTNLWIEIIGVTNKNAYLTLHDTRLQTSPMRLFED